jgi:hypothetical protein
METFKPKDEEFNASTASRRFVNISKDRRPVEEDASFPRN